MPIKRDYFELENPEDFNNYLMAVRHEDGTIKISIADEKAVDSYNSVFTCDFELTTEQATQLSHWLLKEEQS